MVTAGPGPGSGQCSRACSGPGPSRGRHGGPGAAAADGELLIGSVLQVVGPAAAAAAGGGRGNCDRRRSRRAAAAAPWPESPVVGRCQKRDCHWQVTVHDGDSELS
jgi:hypothetical protein